MKHGPRVIILAGLLLAFSIPSPAATRVTVGGRYEGAFGPTVVAFQGIAKRDGSFAGQLEQHNPAIDLAIHAEMNCVVPLGEGRAVATGIITRTKEAGEDWQDIVPGKGIIIVVVDGARTPDGEDLVSVWWEFPNWATCEDTAGVAMLWYEFMRDFDLFAPLKGSVHVTE